MSSIIQNNNNFNSLNSLIGRIVDQPSNSVSPAALEALTNVAHSNSLLPIMENLAKTEALWQDQLKEHSLISQQEETALARYNPSLPLSYQKADEFMKKEGYLLALVLGDSFINETLHHQHDSFVSAYMASALESLLSLDTLFTVEERAQIEKIKPYFTKISASQKRIGGIKSEASLSRLCTTIGEEVQKLIPGEPYFIGGGWSLAGVGGHVMLYQVKKQENGLYSFCIFNSGSGLASYHDQALVGHNFKHKPVVEYRDIPESEILLSHGTCKKGFFFMALLEPEIDCNSYTARPTYDAEHIYSKVLGHLEKYRVAVPDQELSGFISSQRSGTCRWKVNTALLRTLVPHRLYKKILPVIKANKLLESWKTAATLFSTDDTAAAQMRGLFTKAAKQLSKRLAKIYAKQQGTGDPLLPEKWILTWTSTAMDMLSQLAVFEHKIVNDRKGIAGKIDFEKVDNFEFKQRKDEISKIDFPRGSNFNNSIDYTLPVVNLTIDAATFEEQIGDALVELRVFADKQPLGLSFVRSYIQTLAARLPLPNDHFWSAVENPEKCLDYLAEMVEYFCKAALVETAPTFHETMTFLTFYTISHGLAVRIEDQLIEAEKKKGIDVPSLFKNYAIYDPCNRMNEDRYLFSEDVHALERMERLQSYLEDLKKDEKKQKKTIFDFTRFGSINHENLQWYDDLEFCEKFIETLKIEPLLDAMMSRGGPFDWMYEVNTSVKAKRIAILHSTISLENTKIVPNLFILTGRKHLLQVKRLAFFSHYFANSHAVLKDYYGRPKNDLSGQFNPHIEIQKPWDKKSTYLYLSKNLHSGRGDYPTSSYLENYSSIFTRRTLLPPFSQTIQNFIEEGYRNSRLISYLNQPVAEVQALEAAPLTTDKMEGIILRLADRTTATFLQPHQLLSLFRHYMNELGGKTESISYQVLFFTLFFRTWVGKEEGDEESPILTSTAITQLRTQVSLRKLASQFIEEGLSAFWLMQPGTKPQMDGCLFFIQLAQRIRLCLKDTEFSFMAGLEKRSLDVWVKSTEFSKQQLANLHLHRLHGYCTLAEEELKEEEIVAMVTSWVYLQQNPVAAAHLWPEIERRVESDYLNRLAKLELKGALLNSICHSALNLLGLQVQGGTEQWEAGDAHPNYRLTLPNEMFWEIDLATGEVRNEKGVMKDTTAPFWVGTLTFKRIFGDRKHDYRNVGGVIYFTDPVLGQMRCFSPTNLENSLQCRIKGEWCQYVTPETFRYSLPNSLLAVTHLWAQKSGERKQALTGNWKDYAGSILICERDLNRPVGLITSEGVVTINVATEFEGTLENEPPYRLRLYDRYNGKNPFAFTAIEDSFYIEQRYQGDQLVQVAFPRYRSRSHQPLVFDSKEGQLRWRHDARYALAPIQNLGLMPAGIKNYLIIQDDSGKRKLIVPCRTIHHTDPLSPYASLDVEGGECMTLDPKQIGSKQYLEYQVTVRDELIANKFDEQLFLAYLYLQERNYETALLYLNKIERVDTLSPLCLTILQWIIDLPAQNSDISPSATAIRLQAFLKLWPQKSRERATTRKTLRPEQLEAFDGDTTSELLKTREIYIRYLRGMVTMDKSIELNSKQELHLIKLFADLVKDPLVMSRHSYLQQPRNEGVYPHVNIGIIPRRESPTMVSFPRIDPIHVPEERDDDDRYRYFYVSGMPDIPSQAYAESDTWASNRSNYHFFWNMLDYALTGTTEDKRALKYKLNLIGSTHGKAHNEDSILLFLADASRDILRAVGSKPRLNASAREKALWYQNLVTIYNANASAKGVEKTTTLAKKEVKETNTEFKPLLLKNEPWKNLRLAVNLPTLQLGELLNLPNQVRFHEFNQHFKLRDPSPAESKPLALSYDPTKAPKEEEPYAYAIAKEYEEFTKDFNAGKEQVLSQKHWLLKGAKGVEELTPILKKRHSALNETVFSKRTEILKLANALPQDHAGQIQAFLHHNGDLHEPLKINDLVYLFLKQNRELFEKANPALKGLTINHQDVVGHLYQMIGSYLWMSTEAHTLERTIALCEKINKNKDVEYNTQLLAQELSAEHYYDPSKNPEYLVFEYCSNLIMREKQVKLLDLMLQEEDGRYKDSVIQLIMGGGKTSVLASLLCHLAAKPGRFSLFITPASQYETVKENLKSTQRRCFNQSILPLDFRRDELSAAYIREMLQDIKNAIDTGEMALMKVECLQMLELEFICTMRAIYNKKPEEEITPEQLEKRDLLCELLILLREKADALIDEIDLVLNAIHTVNFPEGERSSVPAERIELLREIYAALASPAIKVTHPRTKQQVSLKDYVGLQLNRQTLLTQKDIFNTIAPAIALHLAEHHQPLMMDKFVDSFVRYVCGQMDPKLEELIGASTPEIASKRSALDAARTQDLQFLDHLRGLSLSKNPHENEAANLVALTKHSMRTLLPITFGKSGGRHYGRTRASPPGKVVPYLAVDTPATTEFGYHYEALAYQFQTALQFGINKEQILQLAKNMRTAAERYVVRKRVNFDATAEAEEFEELTGVRLADIEVPGNLEKAEKFIKEAVLKDNIKILLNVEAETAVETVTYHAERIESTAPNSMCMVSTRRGFSGTLANTAGFIPSLADGTHLDVGTEGQVAFALLERMAKNELAMHIAQSEDPGMMLRDILLKHPKRERVRGFMDPGGVFKKTDNITVARSLLATLQELQPNIKGILFFYRAEGMATADKLAVLRPNETEPTIIEGTKYEEIQKTINVEDYFVYYDDRHTTGTDILQVPSAINLVTVDETLVRRGFFQAVLRLRQFFFNQTVELVIPEASRDRLVDNGQTIQGIMENIVKNQAIEISKGMYRSYKQLMDNAFRQVALHKLFLICASKEESSALFGGLEKFLVGKNRDVPYEAFGGLDSEIDSVVSLTRYRDRQLAVWKNQGFDNDPSTKQIEVYLEAIIGRAKASPILQSYVLEMGTESMGVEQEVNVEVESEVEEEVEVELETELQLELRRYQEIYAGPDNPEAVWKPVDWEKLVKGLQEGKQEIDGIPSDVNTLQQLLTPRYRAGFSYERPYHQIFGNLLATRAFVESKRSQLPIFHKAHRPAEQLLLVKTGEKVVGVLLSAFEAQQMKKWLNDNQENELLKEVWIVQPDSSLLEDNSECLLPVSNQVRDLFLAVNAFNGNADYMDRNPQETLRWLTANNAEIDGGQGLRTKINFLKMKVENHPKQRRIFQNSRTLQPERVAAGQFKQVEYIGRVKHNRLMEYKPEQIPEITDLDILQSLPDEQMQYVSPKQVPLLTVMQHCLLKMKEQLAAIPRNTFMIELISQDQAPLLADWQVQLIRDNRGFLHLLGKEQVNWIDPNEVNNLMARQFAWITEPALLKKVKGNFVPYINKNHVNDLTDVQLPFLQGEQIRELSSDRLIHLTEGQLEEVSPQQAKGNPHAEVATKLEAIKQKYTLITPSEVPKIVKIAYAHKVYLTESCMEQLTQGQVQQFDNEFLTRLPKMKLKDLSKAQLEGIAVTQVEIIHRLAKEQFFRLKPACLLAISTEQVQSLETEADIMRLPDVKLDDLSQEQLNSIRELDLILKLPGKMIYQLPVRTIWRIPFSSLKDLDQDKMRNCSFFQKLVLSIHYLAIGIFTLIPRLAVLVLCLPIVIFGYSIRERWNSFTLSLSHLKWSVTIWLPPAT